MLHNTKLLKLSLSVTTPAPAKTKSAQRLVTWHDKKKNSFLMVKNQLS